MERQGLGVERAQARQFAWAVQVISSCLTLLALGSCFACLVSQVARQALPRAERGRAHQCQKARRFEPTAHLHV